MVGDPGIGKSRLLYEFALRHSADKVVLMRGNCSADGQETPFLPFIEVVRGFFGDPRGAARRNHPQTRRGLEAGRSCFATEPWLIAQFLGFGISARRFVWTLWNAGRTRTRDLLFQLVEAQCLLSPVVLLLEDLHWIDSASEELLHRIVASEKKLPLTIFHTRRPTTARGG